MGRAARGYPAWLGVALVATFVVAIALVTTILAGPAPPVARSAGELNVSLSSSTWAALFLAPFLIGFAAYGIRWVVESPMSTPARIGISVTVVVVVALVLSGLALRTLAGGSGSLVVGSAAGGADSIGGVGGTGTGSGTSGSGNGTGGAPVNVTNGTGSGGNSSGFNGTGIGSGGKGHGGGTGSGNTSGSGSGGNSTGGSDGANNTSFTAARAPSRPTTIGIPPWVALAAMGILGAVAGLLMTPGALARLLDRPRSGRAAGRSEADLGAIRTGLSSACAAIESGEDPRATIVRLYGRFLESVGPAVSQLESATPREIERALRQRFRLAGEVAEALTRMFEEARYSSHPIPAPAAERYVQAMRSAERDLFLGGVAS